MEPLCYGDDPIEDPTRASVQIFHECVLGLFSGMLYTTMGRVLRRKAISREEFSNIRKSIQGRYLHRYEETRDCDEPTDIHALSQSLRSSEVYYRRIHGREEFLPLFRRAQDQLGQELYGDRPTSFHDIAFGYSIDCFHKLSEYFSHYDREYDDRLKQNFASGARIKNDFKVFQALLEREAARAMNILADDSSYAREPSDVAACDDTANQDGEKIRIDSSTIVELQKTVDTIKSQAKSEDTERDKKRRARVKFIKPKIERGETWRQIAESWRKKPPHDWSAQNLDDAMRLHWGRYGDD